MSLFTIAFKNIKRNFYNYFLYFISMVFSIMIYYTFTSIQYNQQVIALAKESLKVSTSFKASAIIIAVFSAMFILYSNSFFTRKRKKEVALYCMLGLKKREVARMLFYENLVMGVLALITGILIGSLFSKLFIMILIKLMSFEVTVKFSISINAILYTIGVFLVLFIITSLHGYSLIYRYQLIDLFKSEKTGQNIPKASPILALLSLLLIGTGYYLAVTFNYSNLSLLIVILIFTVIGTYIFFSSLVLFIVKLLKRNKVRYFSGLNMIGTSHILFRIKSHARSLATIAVLSATTITAMGTAGSLYYNQITDINVSAPFSYVYISKDNNFDKKVDDIINKFPENKLKTSADIELLTIDMKWPNLSKIPSLKTESKYQKDYIMSEIDLIKIFKARNINEQISFNENEVIAFIGAIGFPLESPKDKTIYFKVKDKELPFTVKDFKTYVPVNRFDINNSYLDSVTVVKDEVYNNLRSNNAITKLRCINIENQLQSKELTTAIQTALFQSSLYDKNSSIFSSHYVYFTDTMSAMGIVIFLAFFIGMVFLICTGSILFFKQLSEANDDKDRYEILKKIGVKNSEIKISIAKQMLFVFLLPLLIGIIHSIFALNILQPLLPTRMLYPVCLTIGIYTLIYLIYYFLTVNSYYKIVN